MNPAHAASPLPSATDSIGKSIAIPGQRFVARQPIFDHAQKVIGYELLFRNGLENYFSGDPELASRSTLDTSIMLGLTSLCHNTRAFVNCTRQVLLTDLVTLLPPHQTVVEILETVAPEQSVFDACGRLKQAGYLIALDDFVPNDPRTSLCGLADIIKVDIRATPPEERAAMLRNFGSRTCKMLAEKVETWQDFNQTRNLGFSYFQGYFFFRPEVVVGREVPANRLRLIRFLDLVSRPELDLRELEKALRQDVSMCYRLLRYLNSPLFGFTLEIKSVQHAMALLGERELRRWIRLVVAVGAAEQKCSELVLMALTRARFCELLSVHLKSEIDMFLMGLLSMMDAILEIEMISLLEQLPVQQIIKLALLGQPGPLSPFYQLMLAQESGEWTKATELGQTLGLTDAEVGDSWWLALNWAQEVSGAP